MSNGSQNEWLSMSRLRMLYFSNSLHLKIDLNSTPKQIARRFQNMLGLYWIYFSEISSASISCLVKTSDKQGLKVVRSAIQNSLPEQIQYIKIYPFVGKACQDPKHQSVLLFEFLLFKREKANRTSISPKNLEKWRSNYLNICIDIMKMRVN